MIWKGTQVAGTFKDKGLVIREHPAGERDKRLTLILLGRGRATVFAKGAGSPKSKFHACAQIFAFSDFVFYEGAGYLSVSQCELVQNFFGVRRDFERLCLASHVLELADKMILPDQPCHRELRIIYQTLLKLSGEEYPPRLAAAVFEFKLFQIGGFSPVTGRCFSCNKGMEKGGFFTYSGMVCENCVKDPVTNLSAAAAKALAYILESEPKDLFSFTLAPGPTAELWQALDLFRRQILDSPPKSLEML